MPNVGLKRWTEVESNAYIRSKGDTVWLSSVDIEAPLDASEPLDTVRKVSLLRAVIHMVREGDLDGSFMTVIVPDTIGAVFALMIVWLRPLFSLRFTVSDYIQRKGV
jgi:hypothetical protein